MRFSKAGHVLFAATLIALGVYGLGTGHFGAIWSSVPKAMPGRDILTYVCAILALGTGAGLLWRPARPWAAGILTISLLAWMLLFSGRFIWLAPLKIGSWENPAETAVLAAAAWSLFAGYASGPAVATGGMGQRLAHSLYGVALIVFGVAHIGFFAFTASLVPAWLPWHSAWTWFTAVTYIAAGLAVMAGVLARWAAILAAVQIGLFTLLVWGPQVAAGSSDPSVWSETTISWALTAAAWVLAESYGRGFAKPRSAVGESS
jgi:uncharacterized membrane protein